MHENTQIRAKEEVDFFDLLIDIVKHKKMVLTITGAAALFSLVVSIFLPKIYTASTTILPPQQGRSNTAAMLGQLGALTGMAGGGLGIKNPSDMYVGMLKSRNVEDDLVKRFQLKKLYHTGSDESARNSLERNTVISAGRDGFIKINFSDKDPKRAADIANAYVDELERLTARFAVTEASQRRIFYERQLKIVKDNLAKAEFDLQKLQIKTGLIQVYPQEREIAESNAKLRAEVAAKEVLLSAMRVGVTQTNPEYVRLKNEIDTLKKKLDGVDEGSGFDSSTTKESIEYIEKFRSVKYNQAVLEMLYKEYELAKIDEAKDYPMIQVLDKANPPEHKSKPRRFFIVVSATMSALVFSVLYAFIKELIERIKLDPRRSKKMEILKGLVITKKNEESGNLV